MTNLQKTTTTAKKERKKAEDINLPYTMFGLKASKEIKLIICCWVLICVDVQSKTRFRVVTSSA